MLLYILQILLTSPASSAHILLQIERPPNKWPPRPWEGTEKNKENFIVKSRGAPAERRRHKRFLVPNGTLAVFGRSHPIVGSLVDISMGGLAFRYVTEKELPKEASEIDILLADGLSHLYGLPCETVYDIETVNKKRLAIMTERRRGLKFGKLSPNQKLHLEYFIKHHTTDELPAYGTGGKAAGSIESYSMPH